MQKKRFFLIGALALALSGSLTGAANASDDPARVSTVDDSACEVAGIVVKKMDGKIPPIKDRKVLEEGKGIVVREKDGKITVIKGHKVLEEGKACFVRKMDGGEPAIARGQTVKVEVRDGKVFCMVEEAPAK